MIDASINVPKIVSAMRKKRWGMRETCANCGVNNKTLETASPVFRRNTLMRLFGFWIVLRS